MESQNAIRRQVTAKLADLQLLIRTWSGGLWLLMAGGSVAIAFLVVYEGWHIKEPAFLAALIAGLVALFGHLFSKLADFRKQYIEIEYAALEQLGTLQKRLIAFHAEIAENLAVLYKSYEKTRREGLIDRISSDVTARRFTKSDTSNPIFDDNRQHIYEFGAPVIRTIINYYNLESNLNLAVEALLMKEFHELAPVQKLRWYIYMFDLVNGVAKAGVEALGEIEKQLDDISDIRTPAGEWEPITEHELLPLNEALERLSSGVTPEIRRSGG